MPAFHPRTLHLLYGLRDSETVQYETDTRHLDRLPKSSQQTKAQALRERVEAFPFVAADLVRLLEFAEGVNRLTADHDAGLHDDGTLRLTCPACIARDNARTAAEVLSATPLATAFGAEPGADLTTAMARYSSSHGTDAAYDTTDPHDAALAEQVRAEADALLADDEDGAQ